MSISVCLECGAYDSHVSNGDCGGCNECHSIEQGFIWVDDFLHYDGLVVDEDGYLYHEGYEIDGEIGCEYIGEIK